LFHFPNVFTFENDDDSKYLHAEIEMLPITQQRIWYLDSHAYV